MIIRDYDFDNPSVSPIIRFGEECSILGLKRLIDIEKNILFKKNGSFFIIFQEQKLFRYKKKIIKLIEEENVLLIKELFHAVIDFNFQIKDTHAVLDGSWYYLFSIDYEKSGRFQSPLHGTKKEEFINIINLIINCFSEQEVLNDIYFRFSDSLKLKITKLVEEINKCRR